MASRTCIIGNGLSLTSGLITGPGVASVSLQMSAGSTTSIVISPGSNIFFPIQASTAPTYQKGGIYYDLTSGRIAVGDLTVWRMV